MKIAKIKVFYPEKGYYKVARNFGYKIYLRKWYFPYNNQTTIRDLFMWINKATLYKPKEECIVKSINSDRHLSFLYRIKYNEEYIYLFDLDIKIIDILSIVGKNIDVQFMNFGDRGGDVLKDQKMKFYMHSNEKGKHNIPHVHVDCAGKSVIISIMDCTVLAGELKPKDLKYAIKRIENNQNALMFSWNTITNSDVKIIRNEQLIASEYYDY